MELVGIIALVIFAILLGKGLEKEWNRFLFVLSLIGFVPCAVCTLAVLCFKGVGNTGFVVLAALTLIFGFGLVIVLERSRCPRCKKYFKAKKLNEEFVEEGKIYHRNDKTYQKNLYRKDYVCMDCEHEWSKNVRREEEV